MHACTCQPEGHQVSHTLVSRIAAQHSQFTWSLMEMDEEPFDPVLELNEFFKRSGIDDDEKAQGLIEYVLEIEKLGLTERLESKAHKSQSERKFYTKRLPSWLPAATAWAGQYQRWLVNHHEFEVAHCPWQRQVGKKSVKNAQALVSSFKRLAGWLAAPLVSCEDEEVRI
jgi:hypothetical protein